MLWVDSHGELFVQLVGNDDTGTFSRLAFSVKNYEAMRHVAGSSNGLKGRDLDTGETITVEDNNNAAFLRAALKDLLD